MAKAASGRRTKPAPMEAEKENTNMKAVEEVGEENKKAKAVEEAEKGKKKLKSAQQPEVETRKTRGSGQEAGPSKRTQEAGPSEKAEPEPEGAVQKKAAAPQAKKKAASKPAASGPVKSPLKEASKQRKRGLADEPVEEELEEQVEEEQEEGVEEQETESEKEGKVLSERRKRGRPPLAEPGHFSEANPLPIFKLAKKKRKSLNDDEVEYEEIEEKVSTPKRGPGRPKKSSLSGPKAPLSSPAVRADVADSRLKCNLEEFDDEDSKMMAAATLLNSLMIVKVCIVDAIGGGAASDSLVGGEVHIEVPETATVALLKRAISRATDCYVWPSMQDISIPLRGGSETGSLDPKSTLRSHGIGAKDTVWLRLGRGDERVDMVGVQSVRVSFDSPVKFVSAAKRTGASTSQHTQVEAAEPSQDGPAQKAKGRVKKWTVAEIEALVDGVSRFGFSWSQIKPAYEEQLKCRSQVNLKDKWRNLQIGMSTNWENERVPLPEEIKEKISKLHNFGRSQPEEEEDEEEEK